MALDELDTFTEAMSKYMGITSFTAFHMVVAFSSNNYIERNV